MSRFVWLSSPVRFGSFDFLRFFVIQQLSHHPLRVTMCREVFDRHFMFYWDLNIKMVLPEIQPSGSQQRGRSLPTHVKERIMQRICLCFTNIYIFFCSTSTMHSEQKVMLMSFPSSRGHCVSHPKKIIIPNCDTWQNNRKWRTKQRKQQNFKSRTVFCIKDE